METNKTNHYQKDNDYIRKINELRTSLFKLANEKITSVVTDKNEYLRYLSLQSRIGYNVINTLLVLSQFPDATLLKDFSKWKEKNIYIQSNTNGIQILEPKGTFQKKDGTFGINYRPKYVFDVSQTTSGMIQKKYKTPIPVLLKALTLNTAILPKIVKDDTVSSDDVYYDKENNCILVKEHLEENNLIRSLIKAYCIVENYNEYDVTIYESVAYMLCTKYDISDPNSVFSNDYLSYYSDLNEKEIREELYKIKNLYDALNKRIEKGLYDIRNESKTKMKQISER